MKGEPMPIEASLVLNKSNFPLKQHETVQFSFVNTLKDKLELIRNFKWSWNSNGKLFYTHHLGAPIVIMIHAYHDTERGGKYFYEYTTWTKDGHACLSDGRSNNLETVLDHFDEVSQMIPQGLYLCPECKTERQYEYMRSWSYAGWVCKDCYSKKPRPAPDTSGS